MEVTGLTDHFGAAKIPNWVEKMNAGTKEKAGKSKI